MEKFIGQVMIKVFSSLETLNEFAVEKFIALAKEAIEERGQFTVALSGGSTPKSFYQLLASEKFRDKINWKAVFFFFGDERNVPPESEESNFRMANEILFVPLKIDHDKIYRWETDSETAAKVAEEYGERVKFFFRGFPTFDLILLGMGADGHTASLFPFTDALKETDEIAVSNFVEKLDTTRLTVTFPVINKARNVIFLIKGADKAETLKTVLEGNFQPEKFPAQNVKPAGGKLFWLVDDEAAALLQL